MKPRICMVVQNDYFCDPRLRRYGESLADNGAQVDVICARGSRGDRQIANSYRDDINVYRIPIAHNANSLLGYVLEYSFAFLFFSLRLVPLHIRRRYQVIHIHNMPDFLVFSGLFCRFLGAKLLIDIHDPMPEFFLSKYDRPDRGFLVRLLRYQEQFSTRFADRVVTANINFAENLVCRGTPQSKITVVNNIADANVFDRARHPRQSNNRGSNGSDCKFILLYPGTLADRYGLDLPIRAAVKLRKTIPNLLIRLVGSQNEYAEQLKRLAKDLKVEDLVEILPHVPIREVPGLMAKADLGIYTAYPSPHMNIAPPTKVFEFVQMGLPVIASRLPVLEQCFDDNSMKFFSPGNVEAFSAAVEQLWSDPCLRQGLADGADRGFQHENCWHNEQSKYFSLLNEMVGSSLPTDVSPTSATIVKNKN